MNKIDVKILEVRIFNQNESYFIPFENDCNYDNNLTMCERLVEHLPNGITEDQKQRVMLYRYEFKIIE